MRELLCNPSYTVTVKKFILILTDGSGASHYKNASPAFAREAFLVIDR
ncbi:MAG TPA: hypothetical protein VNK49_00725 [Anaerolineales bacterium]|nr:hypothetical protein [Anaerolineales bacterium]